MSRRRQFCFLFLFFPFRILPLSYVIVLKKAVFSFRILRLSYVIVQKNAFFFLFSFFFPFRILRLRYVIVQKKAVFFLFFSFFFSVQNPSPQLCNCPEEGRLLNLCTKSLP